MLSEASIHVHAMQWSKWMWELWFEGFQGFFFPSGEAARTRSVAKRSLKESGMVASRVATKTVGEWEC